MQISVSMVGNNDYKDLCDVDAKIRSAEEHTLEWTPAMIAANDDALIFPKRLRNMYRRRLGLENVSGPFYPDHYFNDGIKHTELPV